MEELYGDFDETHPGVPDRPTGSARWCAACDTFHAAEDVRAIAGLAGARVRHGALLVRLHACSRARCTALAHAPLFAG